jgi:uncharacterized membrane protein
MYMCISVTASSYTTGDAEVLLVWQLRLYWCTFPSLVSFLALLKQTKLFLKLLKIILYTVYSVWLVLMLNYFFYSCTYNMYYSAIRWYKSWFYCFLAFGFVDFTCFLKYYAACVVILSTWQLLINNDFGLELVKHTLIQSIRFCALNVWFRYRNNIIRFISCAADMESRKEEHGIEPG